MPKPEGVYMGQNGAKGLEFRLYLRATEVDPASSCCRSDGSCVRGCPTRAVLGASGFKGLLSGPLGILGDPEVWARWLLGAMAPAMVLSHPGAEPFWPRWRSAVSGLLEKLRRTGVKSPGAARVPTGEVLKTLRLASSSWPWLTELLDRLRLPPGSWPSVLTPTAGIAGYGKAQRWQEAQELLSRVKEGARDLRLDSVALSAAIGAAEAAACWERALRLMKEPEVQPSSRGCTSAASACARRSEWTTTLQLFKDTPASSIMGCTAAVTGCEKASRWSKAVLLSVAAMQRRLSLDDMALNGVMQACAEGEEWQLCLELASLSGDVVSQNIVTKACSGPRWVQAICSLCSIVERFAQTDMVGYSAAMQACGAERWSRAQGLFQELRLHELEPDIIASGSWLNVLSGWAMALAAMQDLVRKQFQPDAPAYNSLIGAEGGSWSLAFSLLQVRNRFFGVDAVSAGVVVLACSAAAVWSTAFDILQSLVRHRMAPNTRSIAAMMSACEQNQLLQVRDSVMQMLPEAVVDGIPPPPSASVELRAAVQAIQGAVASTPRPLARPAGYATGRLGRLGLYRYFKELQLLRYVLRNLPESDSELDCRARSVCTAIEDFGRQGGSRWLKVAGDRKAQVLLASVSGAEGESDVMEIGTYCGYSALRMAACLRPGVAIHSLEADPIHVVIAKNILALAGREGDAVRVWTGHSQVLLPRWRPEGPLFGAVFMDQRGSRYDEDLDLLESRGLLTCGAVVVADNVLKPGAPLFLWRLKAPLYKCQLLSLQEFAMPCEDWMSVSLRQRSSGSASSPLCSEPPPSLLELHLRAETMRKLATRQGGASISFEEWSAFACRMRQSLGLLGISATATLSELDPSKAEAGDKRSCSFLTAFWVLNILSISSYDIMINSYYDVVLCALAAALKVYVAIALAC